MKRFAVFAGDNFYPAGGWNDFREEFGALQEAKAYVEAEFFGGSDWWWQIVDLDGGRIVKDSDGSS